jgi:hypothetical protein
VTPSKVSKKIGQILLEAEVITESELNKALLRQKENGDYLGKNLIELGYIDEDEIVQYIAEQYKIPCVSLDRYEISRDLSNILHEDISRSYGMIPLELIADILTVGIVDVPEEETLRRLEELTGFKIQVVLITYGDFNRYMQRTYDMADGYGNRTFDNTEVGTYIKTPLYEGRERRRFPRFSAEIRIRYEHKDEYNINSSINISQCGVLIRAKSPVPVDSHLVIRMELPTAYEDIIIVSRVVRVERPPEDDTYIVALDFSSMDSADSKKLAGFVKTLTK